MKSQQCCTVDEGLLPQPYMSITVLLLSFLLFSTWHDKQIGPMSPHYWGFRSTRSCTLHTM